MVYQGSKNRISQYILPIILSNRYAGQYYVEPFCGGCNAIDKVTGNRIGADNNKYLISLWNSLQNNKKFPTVITKSMYDLANFDYKNSTNEYYSDDEIGYIGFIASYNGRFFDGGYQNNTNRNFHSERVNNIRKQLQYVKNVLFVYSDYSRLNIPRNSIIYCDIPYKDSKQYAIKKFNHNEFYLWCYKLNSQGHTIYVSEYWMPKSFVCIWQKELNSNIGFKNKRSTEKLFTLLKDNLSYLY